MLDLSANGMEEFPLILKTCVKLKELRLIHNRITEVPEEFYRSRTIRHNLEILILNNNPLKELLPNVKGLKKLKTLGIASTEITKLPSDITECSSLEDIYVHNTPLKTPKLVLAMRGFKAIKEYFEGLKSGENEKEEMSGLGRAHRL